MTLPDFLIIGSMKCGTSTLQAQLAAQSGVFMTTPKEPNFFSDDDVFSKGLQWYEGLFADAAPDDLKGEASTHYTKLPTYPQCVVRLVSALDRPKLIYMIRNPVTRTVSHFIHEWTMGQMSVDLNAALEAHPELVDYSRYAMQIAPYVEAYGADQIYLTSLEHLQADPQAELDRIGAFLGLPSPLFWKEGQSQVNVSAERIRRFPFYNLLVDSSAATTLRRTFIPKKLRERVKNAFRMQQRPELTESETMQLERIFIEDYHDLRTMFPDHAHLTASYPFATT